MLSNGAMCINSEIDLIEKLKKIYPFESFKIQKIKNLLKTNIPKEYQEIYSILADFPLQVDFIAEKLNISLNELQSKLFMMELDDYVVKICPNCYMRKKR